MHTANERTQYALNTILLRGIKSRQWDPGEQQQDNVVEGTKEFKLCSTQYLGLNCNSYTVQCILHCAVHNVCCKVSSAL